MKTRYLAAAVTGLLGMLFARRRSYFGMAQAGGWTSNTFGQDNRTFRPWGLGSQVRQPRIRPVRPRKRGPLSGLFGSLWGMFWLWFGLSFVFGWDEPRNTVLGFFTSFVHNFTPWVTALARSWGGTIQ